MKNKHLNIIKLYAQSLQGIGFVKYFGMMMFVNVIFLNGEGEVVFLMKVSRNTFCNLILFTLKIYIIKVQVCPLSAKHSTRYLYQEMYSANLVLRNFFSNCEKDFYQQRAFVYRMCSCNVNNSTKSMILSNLVRFDRRLTIRVIVKFQFKFSRDSVNFNRDLNMGRVSTKLLQKKSTSRALRIAQSSRK